MEKANTDGKMAEVMLDYINTIKNTVSEHIHGQMAANTQENGKIANETEEVK